MTVTSSTFYRNESVRYRTMEMSSRDPILVFIIHYIQGMYENYIPQPRELKSVKIFPPIFESIRLSISKI